MPAGFEHHLLQAQCPLSHGMKIALSLPLHHHLRGFLVEPFRVVGEGPQVVVEEVMVSFPYNFLVIFIADSPFLYAAANPAEIGGRYRAKGYLC
jgi:hypothetical protein